MVDVVMLRFVFVSLLVLVALSADEDPVKRSFNVCFLPVLDEVDGNDGR
jgi:hypothetical protein